MQKNSRQRDKASNGGKNPEVEEKDDMRKVCERRGGYYSFKTLKVH